MALKGNLLSNSFYQKQKAASQKEKSKFVATQKEFFESSARSCYQVDTDQRDDKKDSDRNLLLPPPGEERNIKFCHLKKKKICFTVTYFARQSGGEGAQEVEPEPGGDAPQSLHRGAGHDQGAAEEVLQDSAAEQSHHQQWVE